MAVVEPYKPEPAAIQCLNDVRIWSNPDMERRTIELRDKAGNVLARVKDVAVIHFGSGYNL